MDKFIKKINILLATLLLLVACCEEKKPVDDKSISIEDAIKLPVPPTELILKLKQVRATWDGQNIPHPRTIVCTPNEIKRIYDDFQSTYGVTYDLIHATQYCTTIGLLPVEDVIGNTLNVITKGTSFNPQKSLSIYVLGKREVESEIEGEEDSIQTDYSFSMGDYDCQADLQTKMFNAYEKCRLKNDLSCLKIFQSEVRTFCAKLSVGTNGKTTTVTTTNTTSSSSSKLK